MTFAVDWELNNNYLSICYIPIQHTACCSISMHTPSSSTQSFNYARQLRYLCKDLGVGVRLQGTLLCGNWDGCWWRCKVHRPICILEQKNRSQCGLNCRPIQNKISVYCNVLWTIKSFNWNELHWIFINKKGQANSKSKQKKHFGFFSNSPVPYKWIKVIKTSMNITMQFFKDLPLYVCIYVCVRACVSKLQKA